MAAAMAMLLMDGCCDVVVVVVQAGCLGKYIWFIL
jgi:hypothetical protein